MIIIIIMIFGIIIILVYCFLNIRSYIETTVLFSDAGNVDGEVDICARFGGFCDDNEFQK